MGVDPSATAADVIRALASKIELQSTDGWALYEVRRGDREVIDGI